MLKDRSIWIFTTLILSATLWRTGPLWTQEPEAVMGLETTVERLRREGFWPRRTFESQGGHVGTAVCAECHPDLAKSQAQNGMALTLSHATPESPGLAAGGTFVLGDYRFRVTAEDDGASGFTVEDGTTSRESNLEWVFGSGSTGHTYLWSQDGVFYESRFSYFPVIEDFADTPGRLRGLPDSLDMAVGHPISVQEARG
ncbi:MAG: hypothetical protein AAF725_27235, partial [Acidobacteriota bacterium]